MRKNVAGQTIGATMVTAADGSAFTGAVTVYVTGDGGTQAVGSVGSGACTHEGQSYHSYAPAQAETNYDHVAFTFTGTGAIPATVQVYTTFPQTVDNATNISAIKTKTDFLPSATAGASGGLFIAGTNAATTVTTSFTTTFTGNLTGSVASVTGAVGSVTGAVGSVTGLTASDVGAIKAKTDNLPSDPADQSLIIAATNTILADTNAIKVTTDKLDDTLEDDAGTFRFTANALEEAPTGGSAPTASAIADEVQTRTIAAVTVVNGLAANVITAAATAADFTTEIQSGLATAATVADLPTNAELATALAAADDAVLSAIASVPTATENADALLNRDMSEVSDTNARSPLNALRFIRNKWSTAGTTLTVTKEDDSTTAWTAVVTSAPGADPISGSDPA
jgi:hypothetical protein